MNYKVTWGDDEHDVIRTSYFEDKYSAELFFKNLANEVHPILFRLIPEVLASKS